MTPPRCISRMRARLCVIGAAVTLLAWTGCQKSAPPDLADSRSPDALARVGGKELRKAEFDQLVKSRQAANPAPVDQRALLDEWIAKETLLQSARRAGLEQDPEVQEILASALIGKLKERQLAPAMETAAVSDDEISAAYERQHDRFVVPERARFAMLILTAPRNDNAAAEAAQQKIQAAITLARADANAEKRGFGALSINYSEDQESRYRGGEIGWVERSRFPQRIEPAVIEAGFALESPGQISDVIRGERGFYAVMLLERKAASALPFENAEPVLRANLLQQKRSELESAFLAKLRAELRVESHPERLPATRPAGPGVPAMPTTLP